MLSTTFAQLRRLPLKSSRPLVAMYSDGAGAIREAGGSFAKREKAQEEQYFHKQQTEQIQKLKHHFSNEIEAHEAEIKRHQEAIARLKKSQADMEEKK